MTALSDGFGPFDDAWLDIAYQDALPRAAVEDIGLIQFRAGAVPREPATPV